jgi:hypothetical protein
VEQGGETQVGGPREEYASHGLPSNTVGGGAGEYFHEEHSSGHHAAPPPPLADRSHGIDRSSLSEEWGRGRGRERGRLRGEDGIWGQGGSEEFLNFEAHIAVARSSPKSLS